LFIDLDGCNNFFDSFRFLFLQFFLLPWLFLAKSMMRWNIFSIDHVAYVKVWSKLEGTPLIVDVELDLPLADVDSSPNGLEERPPKNEWWLLPFSHLEHHKVDRDEVVSDLHRHIYGDAQRIANGVVAQLQTHSCRL
jgi:hypothetical protein